MEVVLAVLRPKQSLSNQEYRHRLYDILLLDSKTPPGEGVKPGKYLPMFFTDSVDEEPKEMVLTQLFMLSGGIKGERALQVNFHSPTDPSSPGEALSNFSLYCVPVSSQDKLNKRFVEQAHSMPGFWSLEYVQEVLNNGSVNFPSPTKLLLHQLESWLQVKHSQPGVIERIFWSRADFRINFTVHNPVFIPSRMMPEGNVGGLPPEIQLTANEAQAKMLAIEKCDIVVMNPLFGSGLPYHPKVNKVEINHSWPNRPIYSEVLPMHRPVEPRWRDKYPLHASAAEGDVQRVQSFLSLGHHHSKKDSIAWAPIHYAAWYGSVDVVDMLLDAGCSPNLTDSELLTPLHIAAKKGFPDVAECLVRTENIDLNMRDKDGKRAIDICTSAPGRNARHQQVASIIQNAHIRPNLTIEVMLMDKSTRHLKLVSGMQTTVSDINQQMLNEFKLTRKFADIFTIWICSKSLELQLKADHRLMEELTKWHVRTVEMLTEADPKEEKPVFKWRRNAKVSVETERQINHPKAVELLFHEAYHNYINGLYPCKDQDVIIFATLLFCIRFPGNAALNRSFLSNVNNLKELIPTSVLRNSSKGPTQWANKVLKEFANNMQGKDLSTQILKRRFLTNCQNLTVYGSAFFSGHLLKDKSQNIPCHVGVNDVGIHIINSQTKQMLHSYKYAEVNWELVLEKSTLEIGLLENKPAARSPRSIARTTTRIRTRQAGVIDHLMRQLKQMNAAADHATSI